MNYKKYYLTSESVTEGHPDKVCDLISDSILDACLEQDENSRVAVETFISNGKVVVAGQITSNAIVDIENIVREKLKEVGYDDTRYNMDYRTCNVEINITRQSRDIALGVDIGGAGDQGIMFGFACNETDSLMPYSIDTAHKLAERLTKVSKKGIIPYLKSDGKVQVTVEYLNDLPFRIDTILISTQHTEDTDMDDLENDIIEYVIKPTVEDDKEKYIGERRNLYVNKINGYSKVEEKMNSSEIQALTAMYEITMQYKDNSTIQDLREAIEQKLYQYLNINVTKKEKEDEEEFE